MRKYLDIVPDDLSKGCLQDVHWGLGYFGYFPTYQVGNWIAAMIQEWLLREDVVSGSGLFTQQQALDALGFLKENYYADAPIVTTLEAIQRITGIQEIDLEPWMRHQTDLIDAVYELG